VQLKTQNPGLCEGGWAHGAYPPSHNPGFYGFFGKFADRVIRVYLKTSFEEVPSIRTLSAIQILLMSD